MFAERFFFLIRTFSLYYWYDYSIIYFSLCRKWNSENSAFIWSRERDVELLLRTCKHTLGSLRNDDGKSMI